MIGEWPATLADLHEPPEGIDTARVGDRIEVIEESDTDGTTLLNVVEVIAVWTRE